MAELLSPLWIAGFTRHGERCFSTRVILPRSQGGVSSKPSPLRIVKHEPNSTTSCRFNACAEAHAARRVNPALPSIWIAGFSRHGQRCFSTRVILPRSQGGVSSKPSPLRIVKHEPNSTMSRRFSACAEAHAARRVNPALPSIWIAGFTRHGERCFSTRVILPRSQGGVSSKPSPLGIVKHEPNSTMSRRFKACAEAHAALWVNPALPSTF